MNIHVVHVCIAIRCKNNETLQQTWWQLNHARIQKILSEGVQLLRFFLVDESWEDPNTTLCGPSSARQRNAILMAFRWRADGGPTLNAVSIAMRFSGDLDQNC